ncbi:hypothetical protein BDV41DRAFT_540597 [Aspergillus transmontanensis]|uniref:Uncharacterized protein n=1 Tax=Aspergillus transmontanensis TaxID=1034304 RepID=A0A5N6VTG9_9EURO|nr:hypothetical protein BDV41DRAFT_540597 [Aspergillus transmontanensis]
MMNSDISQTQSLTIYSIGEHTRKRRKPVLVPKRDGTECLRSDFYNCYSVPTSYLYGTFLLISLLLTISERIHRA